MKVLAAKATSFVVLLAAATLPAAVSASSDIADASKVQTAQSSPAATTPATTQPRDPFVRQQHQRGGRDG
jgi:hypothetical protein